MNSIRHMSKSDILSKSVVWKVEFFDKCRTNEKIPYKSDSDFDSNRQGSVFVGPKAKLHPLLKFLDQNEFKPAAPTDNENTLWEVLAKDRIEKYSKPGLSKKVWQKFSKWTIEFFRNKNH